MTKQKIVGISILLLIVLLGFSVYHTLNPKEIEDSAKPGYTQATLPNNSQTNTNNDGSNETTEETPSEPLQTVVTNLSIPWEIAFLPNEDMLITQRTGEVVLFTPETQKTVTISGVNHIGEGGLLGLVLDPNYAENNYLYLYLTSEENGTVINRVERYTLKESAFTLSDRTVILDSIPGARFHDGGRIAFGPDGNLYITTGDAQDQDTAQDRDSLAGKILRVTPTGEVPADNPFGTRIYSWGHRNPQGIDWDSEGRLWASEHGRSVPLSGYDEVNLITAGTNYGWPEIQGTETAENMQTPVLQSGANTTWAPGDLAVFENTVFFTGLKGESLYTARIDGTSLTNFTKHFEGEFGRLRAVVVGPQGKWLYLSTSNTDGRGNATAEDDRIIKVSIQALLQTPADIVE